MQVRVGRESSSLDAVVVCAEKERVEREIAREPGRKSWTRQVVEIGDGDVR